MQSIKFKKLLTTSQKPRAVITVFSDGDVSYRPFIADGTLGASKPLFDDTINEIFGHLNGSFKVKKFSGVIPKEIMFLDPSRDMISWKVPAGVFKMKHSQFKRPFKYHYPNLIFRLQKSTLSIGAVQSYRKNAKVYMAPFPNLYVNSVCMGSATIKVSMLDYWEDAIAEAMLKFFESEFTHGLVGMMKVCKKGPLTSENFEKMQVISQVESYAKFEGFTPKQSN